MSSFNVLVSSAGRRVTLVQSFRRALAELGLTGRVLATDASPYSSAGQSADRFCPVPRCTGGTFVEFMLDLCVRESVRLIVPTIDPELPVYAAARERFREIGVTVAVSHPRVTAIAGDKRITYEWLLQNGFPTVRQSSAAKVVDDPRAWTLPLIAKPAAGSASQGLSTITELDQLRAIPADYVVQTKAPGEEYTVDVLVNRAGRCVCAVPRRRIEVRAGEVSKAVTVRSQPLQDLAIRIAEALPGTYGALNIQIFMVPETAQMQVLEINARFGGGFPLSWRAGADYPKWLLEDLTGTQESSSHAGWQHGLVMLRYDDAVFVNADELVAVA